jgi:Ca-activated chloride channel family protein
MRLIDRLDGDRIGIIVFAGKAYTQLPITTDYGAAKLFLSNIATDMIPVQGTAIGSAIDLAVASFGDSAMKHNSAIVVITDGENHEDDAIESAKNAREHGITVHTIGMGTENGGPIPVIDNGKRIAYLQDEGGNTVMTKLDESMLVQIASAGNGKFIRASNSDDGLEIIMKEIGKLNQREFATKMFTSYEDQFQWALGIALLFMLLDFAMAGRKSKWIEKWNLFGEKR